MTEEDDIIAAHRHSSCHRMEVLGSNRCGCFYCLAIFDAQEVTLWVDERDGVGQTALCPRCGIDSVIGEASRFPLTPEFLTRMHEYWFEQ